MEKLTTKEIDKNKENNKENNKLDSSKNNNNIFDRYWENDVGYSKYNQLDKYYQFNINPKEKKEK